MKNNVVIVMPAYNAEKTLELVYNKIPCDYKKNIILVDDCSRDKTYEVAKKLGLKVYRNKKNLGYGGNVKMCIKKALAIGANIIIEMHPDNEYDPSAIIPAIGKVNEGADLVLGNRFTKNADALDSGMYIWKYIPSRLLTFIDNIILRTNIADLHQGFRVYTRTGLQKINYLQTSNDYLFSFEIISQTVFAHENVAEIPVVTYYTGKKRGANLGATIAYTLSTWKVLAFFLLAQLGFHLTPLFLKR